MNEIVASVDAPQHGGAGESNSEQAPGRLSGKHKPRVIIVGGGFAGDDADVTLIDRRNHHIFQPLLYQVATDLLAPSEVATPIADCAPATFGCQLPYAPRNPCRNVIREVNACCSRTSVTCQRLGPSRI